METPAVLALALFVDTSTSSEAHTFAISFARDLVTKGVGVGAEQNSSESS